ncbi:MAG: cytochrome c5 family protein [Chlorobiaceae bacterium]|nr:cytochrome c5 family protein [Chlorobiaceae bacterium]
MSYKKFKLSAISIVSLLLGACGQMNIPEADMRLTPGCGDAMATDNTGQLRTAAGKEIFESKCEGCHGHGIGGAPRIGDKDAWENRIAKGMQNMVNNAINGLEGKAGSMPPRGGTPDLSDEEISSAVRYMVKMIK